MVCVSFDFLLPLVPAFSISKCEWKVFPFFLSTIKTNQRQHTKTKTKKKHTAQSQVIFDVSSVPVFGYKKKKESSFFHKLINN